MTMVLSAQDDNANVIVDDRRIVTVNSDWTEGWPEGLTTVPHITTKAEQN